MSDGFRTRPGQGQGKRNNHMRGRNSRGGGGKSGGSSGGNPMHRGFESNGPDVKIRGTAQHIAEKYAQLGRDAQASGDHVLAENYLQYAEHYYRMIAAYQAQFAPEGGVREEGEGATEGAEAAEGGDDMNEGRNFRPSNNYRDNRQNYRNDGGQRYGRNSGPRPEETEQPPVAFPQRDEQQALEAARNQEQRGPRQRFDKRERFSRDRNQQGSQGNRNEESQAGAASETAEALPSFLTRSTRRRGLAEEPENTEGANNNSTPPPPASEA
jgi:hypothetical protein